MAKLTPGYTTFKSDVTADYCRALKKCNELQIPLQDQNVTQVPLQLPLKIST